MEFPIEELIEILSDEIGPNKDLRTVKELIVKHPLTKSEYKNMPLEKMALLIYSVYFVSNGRRLEVLNRLKENIVFYIICDFDFYNTRYESCDNCGGDGETDCSECNGSGEVSCSECDGSGVVDGDDEDSLEDCEVCNGNGEVSCRECNGSGRESCGDCGGDGEVDSGDEVNYRNLLCMSILPLSVIEKMKQKDGELTTEFDNEFNQAQRLTVILDRDPYAHTLNDYNYYWNDIEENAEMFYDVVDGKSHLWDINYPVLD